MLILFLLFVSADAATFTRRWINNGPPDGLFQAVKECIEIIDNTGDCCLPSSNIDSVQGMEKGPCENGYTHLSHWDVSQVPSMDGIFRGRPHFNQPLQWDVSSVTNMDHMFLNAGSFNQHITNWDVSNVTSATDMFGPYFDNLEQPLCGEWLNWSPDLKTATKRPQFFGDETTCVYTCPNGIPLDGIANEAGEIRCASCNSGYLIRSDNSCTPPQCTCPHGTPGVDASQGCVNDSDVACSGCDCGFTLDGHTCVVDQTFLEGMLQYVQDDTLLVNRYKELRCEAQ